MNKSPKDANPPKKHVPKRNEDNATLTISLPKSMKRKILEEAKKDNRTASNFLVNELLKILGVILLLLHLCSGRPWTARELMRTAEVAAHWAADVTR
jgi:hypothetical protein